MTASISLSGVSKRYRKYDDTARVGGRLGALFTRTERSWLTALTDVELEVQPGESVGVIGRNGAGKSTLLQLLCGVTAPTAGTVSVQGRIAPLISVGVGFHPELTGRENIYVNGTILGMSRQQIDARFDAIVEFAELAGFIDTPVKFYSSGMFVRLGFSVAVEARPDVLLVDEVLAVGDFAFQMRCFERMNEIRQAGTTIIVVSHNMSSIRGFCDRGVVLSQGRVVHDGSTFDAIARYYDTTRQREASASSAAEVVDLVLLGEDGRPASHLKAGDEAVLRVRVRCHEAVRAPFLWLGLESSTGVVVYSDARLNEPMDDLSPGEEATFEVRLPVHLPSGGYSVDLSLRSATGSATGDSELIAEASRLSFYVTGRGHVFGAADLHARFTRTE